MWGKLSALLSLYLAGKFDTSLTSTGPMKIVGVWLDGPAHTIYAVVESDSAEAIRKACDGLMDIGPVEVRLISNFPAR